MNQEIQAAVQSSPSVETKLVEMLDAIQHGAVQVGDQLVKYSPDVEEAALWVVRVDGIQSVIRTMLFGLLALTGWLLCRMFYKWHQAACEKNQNADDWIGWMAVTGLVALGATLIFLFTLCNVWDWVAIFQPKLFLAKQVMQAVIK